MSDISKCNGEGCTLKEECYRYTAVANELRQSYADFKQEEDGTCKDFWDNKK